MRTTLTLEPDVAKELLEETRRSKASFKAVVNRYLRLGLSASRQPARKPFQVKPAKLGLPQHLSYDNVEELLQAIEGPIHK